MAKHFQEAAVPPFLPCRPSRVTHCPCSTRYNPKDSVFPITDFFFYFPVTYCACTSEIKTTFSLFSPPLMYWWPLLHWSLNCVSQHSLLILTLVTPRLWRQSDTPKKGSKLLGSFPPKLPGLKVIYAQKGKVSSLQHGRKAKAEPNLPLLSQEYAQNCQLCSSKVRFEGFCFLMILSLDGKGNGGCAAAELSSVPISLVQFLQQSKY